jgi:hypothetical protein
MQVIKDDEEGEDGSHPTPDDEEEKVFDMNGKTTQMTEAVNNGIPHGIQRDVTATVGAETVNLEMVDGEEPSSTFIRGGTTTLGGSVPHITDNDRKDSSAYKAGSSTSDNIDRDIQKSTEINESGDGQLIQN